MDLVITRFETAVRMEARLTEILKELAALLGISVGDLLEGIVLHAFSGKSPFGSDTLEKIHELRVAHGLDLDHAHSHRLKERES